MGEFHPLTEVLIEHYALPSDTLSRQVLEQVAKELAMRLDFNGHFSATVP